MRRLHVRNGLLNVCLLHDDGLLGLLLLVFTSVAVVPAAAFAEDSSAATAAENDTDEQTNLETPVDE